MKKIVGIIPSTLGFDTNNPFDDKYYVQNSYIEKISKYAIPIILAPTKLKLTKEQLDMCDAFILIGGKNIHKYHFEVIDYAIKTNKKLLGICLGMQAIGMYSNNDLNETTLIRIDDHYYDDITHENKELLVHEIEIERNSTLYKLFSNKLKVNSYHNYALKYVTPPFKVIGKSSDVIEAIEYKNIIGVQFHPELMNNTMAFKISFFLFLLIKILYNVYWWY